MNYQLEEIPDFWSKETIQALQLTRINTHLEYLRSKSTFYQQKLADNSVTPLQSLDELSLLPTTSKEELADFASDFVAVPSSEIAEYVTTSGSTGKPLGVPMTKSDLSRIAYNEARALGIAGFSKQNSTLITTTLDKCFVAGMAYYQGLVELGATVIRGGISTPEFHLQLIAQFQPNAIIGVPSFLNKLRKNPKFDPASIRKVLCIGEPLRRADFSPSPLLHQLRESWQADFYSTYASTEMATAFTECSFGMGGHELPELIYTEILDESGRAIEDGELGEITVTPFGIEGMPLLRFRTGDLARKHRQTCACGRTTLRLGPIEGRLSQMIKYKGTTIFPPQLEEVLFQQTGDSLYLIVLELDENGLDQVSVLISDALSPEKIAQLGIAFQANLRVKPTLIPRKESEIMGLLFRDNSRKPKKILDRRHV